MDALGRSWELDAGERRQQGSLRRKVLDALAAKDDPRLTVVHFPPQLRTNRRIHGWPRLTHAETSSYRWTAICKMIRPTSRQLLSKLDEGYDVVSGWRKDRKDNPIKRNLPSRIANRIISRVSGVPLHDYGCSLKAYRRDVLEGVRLYGEMHRFVPIYASWNGARVDGDGSHAPSTAARCESNYGLERIFKVVLDLLVVKFLFPLFEQADLYLRRLRHAIGIFVGGITGIWALVLKLFFATSLIQTPLPLVTVFL